MAHGLLLIFLFFGGILILSLALYGLLISIFTLRNTAPRLGIINRISLLRRGALAQGTIVALERQNLSLQDFYPVVRFTTPQGQNLTLKSKVSGRIYDLSVGLKVEVCYPSGSPEDFIVISGLDVLWQELSHKRRRRQ